VQYVSTFLIDHHKAKHILYMVRKKENINAFFFLNWYLNITNYTSSLLVTVPDPSQRLSPAWI